VNGCGHHGGMKRPFKMLLGATAMILMNACTSMTPNVHTGLKMACLPEAMIMKSALARERISSKILTLRYAEGRRKIGHAVVLFCCGNQLAAWDSTWGSIPIGRAADYRSNSSRLGKMYLNKKQSFYHAFLLSASFVEDSVQSGRYGGL
jgi:hypothetical protein